MGKEAVCGFNEAVFNKFYQAGSTTVEILDEIGDEASSVVRFNMRATARSGNSYDVPPPSHPCSISTFHKPLGRTVSWQPAPVMVPAVLCRWSTCCSPRRVAGWCMRWWRSWTATHPTSSTQATQ